MSVFAKIRQFLRPSKPQGDYVSKGMASEMRSWPWNWWQFTPGTATEADYHRFAPVFACWRIIAEELSRIPIKHFRYDEKGSRSPVMGKAPLRVLENPNQYQTSVDFMMFLGRTLASDGRAYALALRNDRNEVSALYPLHPRNVHPYVTSDGDVYYSIADSTTMLLADAYAAGAAIELEDKTWARASNILDLRLFTLTHPLIGVSPLIAAAAGVSAGMNIVGAIDYFTGNMNRTSGILTHPAYLEDDVIERIKTQFVNAASRENLGKPIVLHNGLGWQENTMTAVDADIVKSYNLTAKQIAQVYRIPPFMLGDLEDAKFSSVEAMTQSFIQSGFGFYITFMEKALKKFFRLPTNERIVMDHTEALLQTDFKTRVEGYGNGVQKGLFTPNEARQEGFDLSSVEGGDITYMQQQMVPTTDLGIDESVSDSTPEPTPESEPEEEPEEEPIDTDLALSYLVQGIRKAAA